jgi:adenylate cyclase
MSDRLGVRGRLLLAFFGISAFAVLAAAAAMYSFLEVGKALDRITQDRVPSAIASQQLSRQAERIAAAAPAMLTVNTAEKHEQISKKMSVDLDRLEALLSALRGRDVDPASLTLIENLVELLGINLITIDTMIINNLVLVERRNELLRDLRFTDISSRRLLAPGILVMDAKLAELREALEVRKATDNQRLREIGDLTEPIISLAPLQRAHAEVSAINDMLIKAASAKSPADLGVLVFPLRRSLDALEKLLASVEPELGARLGPRLAEFREYTDGANSIVGARETELRHLALMQTRVDQNIDISRQLTEAVDRLVSGADRDIRSANLEALSVLRTSAVIMITVVVLSLVCSVLIVWLYVDRNLIARLTGLSDSMLAIAGGNLQTRIPDGGADEISNMGKALVVFRDTAIEVRETNLREIREARRRLTDAIESISEGFSLYDTDDRLVLCNSHYRDALYPGIADIMMPGTPFETILRRVAERGLIKGAEDCVDEWVAKRLALYRDPAGPHLQQQSDGRWIQINERKTEDGGTVAVYSDITELKQHEQMLAEKSNALEQLSNQLAKYLSPQIYDSIFSGKQEVKVASSRKKLTVFFSDIAGFTETTDRLESEELSQLLNHYLTEMSQIALDHGATIDKYMGDAILVFFGDPETKGVKEDALACVSMAIAMRNRLRDLEDIWRQSGIAKPLRCRMGIHTGFCTVGNFGSEDRMDYTIIGGAVNTASRLETLATPGEILISYETLAHIRDQVHCKEHGEIEVKGIAYPLTTYHVVDTYENLGRQRLHFREEHPNVKLDLDLDAMTSEDRSRAADTLHRGLDLLNNSDEPVQQEQAARTDSDRQGRTHSRSGPGTQLRKAR